MRTQLSPHGRRIALARLAIVRHARKRNRAACRLHRVAKAHAQQGRGLKRHALATKARRQRSQRSLLVREWIAVQIDIGKQHGIVAAGAQSRRVGKRSKTNLGTWRTVNLVGLVIVGGATLVHPGANAIEHGHGRDLRHVERAGAVHKDVDDVAQQGRLRLATGLAIQAAQRAIGQRLGNGKHGLKRRHGLVTPQRLEHVRDHTRYVLKPVIVARRLARAPHLALNALQQALNARGSLAARETHILIEGTGIDGISARKRTVDPVGKLRRGPPLGL